MVKVKSLLKKVNKEVKDENGQIIVGWLKNKKKEIRSCQRTLNCLTAELRKALVKDVDDFAEELLDDRFEY